MSISALLKKITPKRPLYVQIVFTISSFLFNIKVAEGLFSLFKINIQTAYSGKEAIELVKSNIYDIVFMDHMMPEMDGVEATAII